MTVYFARAGEDGPVKIGFAVVAEKRIRMLQTGCPYRLLLINTLPGDRSHEAAAHRLFKDYRINGEWFTFHPDMMRSDLVLEYSKPSYVPIRLRPGYAPKVRIKVKKEKPVKPPRKDNWMGIDWDAPVDIAELRAKNGERNAYLYLKFKDVFNAQPVDDIDADES